MGRKLEVRIPFTFGYLFFYPFFFFSLLKKKKKKNNCFGVLFLFYFISFVGSRWQVIREGTGNICTLRFNKLITKPPV